MKTLATMQTYDPNDCTSVGYDWTLRDDGSVTAQLRNCWSGARTDTRWATEPGYIDTTEIAPDDPDNDAEANLTHLNARLVASSHNFEDDPDWRMTRKGHIVR